MELLSRLKLLNRFVKTRTAATGLRKLLFYLNKNAKKTLFAVMELLSRLRLLNRFVKTRSAVKKCEKNFVCVDVKVKKIFLKDKYFLNQFLTFEIR